MTAMILVLFQLLLGVSTSPTGAGSPVSSCSNKLDFSQACNSQYVGVM